MSTPILLCRDIVAGYVPGMPIIHSISLEVTSAEIVSIIGPNGAGKSTFLKAIAGLVQMEGGSISVSGKDVTGLRTDQLVGAGIAFVPQTGNVFTTLTVHENLMVGGHTLGGELKHRLEQAYAQFPALAERRSAPGRVLSGGQRQMLAIARGLMTAPKVIMLDEPTAGLSPKIVGEVFSDLQRLAATGVAVLMVEQNARAALRISDRGYVMAEGRNRLDGKASDLLADPDVGAAFLGVRKTRP
jgi:ABC-type branched-subunit amino acid transport system ATPase component